jgi:spore coat polysaccharide biosynthesis protein SpsF
MDLSGKTVLARVVERLRLTGEINELLVATTERPADDEIVAECQKCAVAVSRGDEDDVLDRYYRAAQLTKADVVVRITSDCPLIDPEITDKTITEFFEGHADYASNALQRTYPRGLDTEVMSFDALSKAWGLAAKPYEREHVTPYIYQHPEEFKLLSVVGDVNYSAYRWTLDTPEDLAFIQAIYSRFAGKDDFSWRDVVEVLDREPELIELNRAVTQKTLQSQ